MNYYRVRDRDLGYRLVASGKDATYDLTAVKPGVTSFADLARAAYVADVGIESIAEGMTKNAPTDDSLLDAPERILPPMAEEVWAAGVTYQTSEEAREAESGIPQLYVDVYDAERPELFFKSTPSRTVGPGERIGVRSDSDWNVPEPELGIVLFKGSIVGYTIGNDVSSRSIEGENPLYLPQAKIYDRSCAVGPCVVSAEAIDDPHDLEMTMEIERDGTTVYQDATSTGEMVRTCEELVEYYVNHNSVPDTAVLLTGTSLVPGEEFTLREDDVVSIDIEGIGTLENPVTSV